GDAERRRGGAGDKATEEQDGDGRRDRHDDVVETEAEVGEQDDRTAPEPVGERALHWREHELHQGERRPEYAEDRRGARHVAALQLQDELREHRDDDPERDHVEQDGDEDEDERRAPSSDHTRHSLKVSSRASTISDMNARTWNVVGSGGYVLLLPDERPRTNSRVLGAATR